MQQDAGCPGAATNYAALGTSKGLAAMSPSERALAVDALKKQPADKELVEQVDKLGTNPTFAQLSADRRREVLESFKSHT
ncbi:MAG TPA: hypothetical protein PKW90_18375, partial [Myxococcota bacterium]|nr:hypothetical protein [Myxococcota bacterium]